MSKTKIRFQKAILNVDFYREGKKFIAYSNPLDLSTCGNSFEEAKKRFGELVSVFFQEITEMGTLEEFLMESGRGKFTNALP